MPMGEVYSAMTKGVIDGVVAPADTFRAMHFAEIASHFNTLAVPRGAYPARAMSAARWNRLRPDQRARARCRRAGVGSRAGEGNARRNGQGHGRGADQGCLA